jgi:hypothetical protein
MGEENNVKKTEENNAKRKPLAKERVPLSGETGFPEAYSENC